MLASNAFGQGRHHLKGSEPRTLPVTNPLLLAQVHVCLSKLLFPVTPAAAQRNNTFKVCEESFVSGLFVNPRQITSDVLLIVCSNSLSQYVKGKFAQMFSKDMNWKQSIFKKQERLIRDRNVTTEETSHLKGCSLTTSVTLL